MRFDDSNGMLTGFSKGVRFENGTLVNMDGVINEHLQDESHIWVILQGLLIHKTFHYISEFLEDRDSKDAKTKTTGKEKARSPRKKV